jgi:ring-1,2-phenylacetyl-CoA epoxidase subunit PaaC
VSEALHCLLIALADDELVLGHRHSEWTGFAPHLEEDVAFSSIAQDEIGHAAAYYELVAKATGDDPDRIALGREATDYRHAVLCERSNRDWAYTLARHWLYDHADDVRLRALELASAEDLAALARKMRREERYHVMHADAWMKRVAAGPVEGRTKIIDALADALGEATGLFEPIEQEDEAVASGFLPAPMRELLARYREETAQHLDSLGLPTDIGHRLDESAEFVASSSGDLIAQGEGSEPAPAARRGLGGRRGDHGEEFQELWADLTATYRMSPGATW